MTPQHEHEWADERVGVAASGPMEGTWWVSSCRYCQTVSLRSIEAPDDSVDAVVDALAARGCDPRGA